MKMLRCIVALLATHLLWPLAQARAAATLLPNGQQCFQAVVGTSGMVGALGTITAGTGGTAGVYANVSLTGGSGSSATANITVSGGVVTAVTILNPGSAYVVGDVLSAASANIGSVSGFSVPVNSVSINSSLAGGTVTYYQPNTAIFKATWTTAAQTVQQTNPANLDQNGCTTVYGTGTYRQVLKDSLGNVIWDTTTTDVSANNSVYWAGTASALGTPNTIYISDAGFNATDGSVINFVPIATNTGPVTINPCTTLITSCFGAIAVTKDTAAGPVALSGGEIAIASGGLGNTVSVLYSASQNNFHLQNLIAAAISPSTPLCGAIGLNITNDTTFPNSKVNITADQINTQTALGTYITRGSPTAQVSVSINFTTIGANGIDTGSLAASTWYNLYAIDNGVAAAALGSLSATAPTMPSGYSYKCRLGAMQTDSSGNLLRVLILGNKGQYKIGTNPANTGAAPVLIANGVTGTFSITSPTLATATVTGNGFCAPPTATAAIINASGSWKSGTAGAVIVAPNTAWGGTNNGPAGSNGNVYPIAININTLAGENGAQQATIVLEAATIAWASSQAQSALTCMGWVDKINAQ